MMGSTCRCCTHLVDYLHLHVHLDLQQMHAPGMEAAVLRTLSTEFEQASCKAYKPLQR